MKFPEPGVVYDYRLDDAGIPLPLQEEEEEEEIRTRKVWKQSPLILLLSFLFFELFLCLYGLDLKPNYNCKSDHIDMPL